MVSETHFDQVAPNRTKIVATIGPGSREPAVLRKLIEVGVDVFRLNFSHGTHDEHSAVLADIRTLSRELGQHVAILQDLCGPKIRLGPVNGEVLKCPLGEEFTLVAERSSNTTHELTCSYRDLPNDLKLGETVLFADGTVAMVVTNTEPGRARLKVTLAGQLRSRQGLNLPGSELAVKSLTDKDLNDLDWTRQHAQDVDYVGLSFVRAADDVARLRRELQARECPARVVVKIEKPQAVQHLEEIIAVTDCVMVARGDLGVEMDVQQVPATQKRIIALCNNAHRPVITATQMLNSMEHSSRPTRAEASDVFNAVLDGTDAVMLSGESAVGEYPIEAVVTMGQICSEAEAYLKSTGRSQLHESISLSGLIEPITEAAVDAAHLMTEQLNAPLIVVATDSGRTALALSNRRPTATILAMTRTEQLARTLALCWGVMPLVRPDPSSAEHELKFAIDWAKSHSLVRSGEYAVLLRGQVAGQPKTRAVLAGEVT
ncbi:MAG TPA: pyruvate kinase [Pyrinomonadaceae bacterium]